MINKFNEITPIKRLENDLTFLWKTINQIKKEVGTIMTGMEKLQELVTELEASKENLAGDLIALKNQLLGLIEQLAQAATADQIEEILRPIVTQLQALADGQ